MAGALIPPSPQLLYPHLRGDLDAGAGVLGALESLARAIGKTITVTSGGRTLGEQASVKSTYGPKAAATPSAPHVRGIAADATIDGVPIWKAVSAAVLGEHGLTTFEGGRSTDPVHVEVAGGRSSSIGDAAIAALGVTPLGPIASGLDAFGVADDVGNAVTDVAGDAAKATAGALVGLLVDALGRDGARVLLSVALVAVALVAILAGGARAFGLRTPPIPLPPQAALLKGALK